MLNMYNSDDVQEFINNVPNRLITVKMISRHFKIKPKIAHRILKYNKNTIMCHPFHFGNNKFINRNLYRIINKEDILELCKKETIYLHKIYKDEKLYNAFMDSNFNKYILDKYRLVIDNNIKKYL